MSEHPAYTLAALTSVGGTIGFLRTRSVPSLLGGVGSGLVYAYAGRRIQTGQDYGYEIAAGNSLFLVAQAAPRFTKGPVPKGLSLLGALGTAYYAYKVYLFRQ